LRSNVIAVPHTVIARGEADYSTSPCFTTPPQILSAASITDVSNSQTPDGNGRLELTKFHSPSKQGDNRHAPANTPGIRHVAFAVEDIDAVVARPASPRR
jgi:hypothetical protein